MHEEEFSGPLAFLMSGMLAFGKGPEKGFEGFNLDFKREVEGRG